MFTKKVLLLLPREESRVHSGMLNLSQSVLLHCYQRKCKVAIEPIFGLLKQRDILLEQKRKIGGML